MPRQITIPRPVVATLVAIATAAAVVACATGAGDDQTHPDIVDATVTRDDDGTFTAAVTVSSPYDSPQRYTDAWRLLSPSGEQLAIRELAHDHAAEQPFTRSRSGIVIPDDIDEVVVQGRDLVNGWGGTQMTVPVQR